MGKGRDKRKKGHKAKLAEQAAAFAEKQTLDHARWERENEEIRLGLRPAPPSKYDQGYKFQIRGGLSFGFAFGDPVPVPSLGRPNASTSDIQRELAENTLAASIGDAIDGNQ